MNGFVICSYSGDTACRHNWVGAVCMYDMNRTDSDEYWLGDCWLCGRVGLLQWVCVCGGAGLREYVAWMSSKVDAECLAGSAWIVGGRGVWVWS